MVNVNYEITSLHKQCNYECEVYQVTEMTEDNPMETMELIGTHWCSPTFSEQINNGNEDNILNIRVIKQNYDIKINDVIKITWKTNDRNEVIEYKVDSMTYGFNNWNEVMYWDLVCQ